MTLRVLIAAGGTGGHLFPALHIAYAIKRLDPLSEIEFVGTGRPLEEILIDKNGFRRHIIPTVGLRHRGIGGFLQFLMLLPGALRKVERIIRSFKPDVVIGVGGYVTFLPVTLAAFHRIPTWIHEAEVNPGLANHVLAHYATVTSTAFPNAKLPRPRRAQYTGHPVRPELAALGATFLPKETPSHILITGGSQGARAIDKGMLNALEVLKDRQIEIWHQSRPENIAELNAGYSAAGISARVEPFIENMVEAYGWADLIIGRAGAGTIMELSVVRRPAIIVPLPAIKVQQRDNARVLAESGRALMIEEGPGFEERFKSSLLESLSAEGYERLTSAPGLPRSAGAADLIAQGVMKLVPAVCYGGSE